MSLTSKLFLARPERTTAVLSVLTSAFHSGDSKKLMGTKCVVLWRLEKGQSNHNWGSFNPFTSRNPRNHSGVSQKERKSMNLMSNGAKDSNITTNLCSWCWRVCEVPSHLGHRSLGSATQPSKHDSLLFRGTLHHSETPKWLFVQSGSNPRAWTHSKTKLTNFVCHHPIEFLTPIQILWCHNDCNFK